MKRKSNETKCSDIARSVGEDLNQLRIGDIYVRLKRHLDRCPNCEAYVDSLKKVVKLYRRYPDPRLTNKVRKRLHAVISLTD